MEFTYEHFFPASPAEVLGAMVDADFYRSLQLPDLSLPEVESATDDGERGQLGLRYTYTGHLDPLARRLLGGGEIVWLQRVKVDREQAVASLTVISEREPDRLHAAGNFAVFAKGEGSHRRLSGELVVGVPIVGPAAERAVLGGFGARLDIEAAALAEHVASGTHET